MRTIEKSIRYVLSTCTVQMVIRCKPLMLQLLSFEKASSLAALHCCSTGDLEHTDFLAWPPWMSEVE
jgi:hypothetical protein